MWLTVINLAPAAFLKLKTIYSDCYCLDRSMMLRCASVGDAGKGVRVQDVRAAPRTNPAHADDVTIKTLEPHASEFWILNGSN